MISKTKSLIADYKLLLNNVPTMITVIFVCGTLAMNMAAAKVIFNFGVVAGTGGIILSWLPFLCMDTVSKRFGARASIMLNILSSLFNILFTVFLALVAAIPTPGQDYTVFNSAFGAVWFIVVASNVAFILSGVVNSLLNVSVGKLFKKTSGVEFFTRSAVSTFIGQIVDNFIFMWLLYTIFAPIFWKMPAMSVWTCLGTGILGGLLELFCEVILTPVGYVIVKNWEKNKVGQQYIDAHSNVKL